MTEEEKKQLAKQITEDAVQRLIEHIKLDYTPDGTVDVSSDGPVSGKAVANALNSMQASLLAKINSISLPTPIRANLTWGGDVGSCDITNMISTATSSADSTYIRFTLWSPKTYFGNEGGSPYHIQSLNQGMPITLFLNPRTGESRTTLTWIITKRASGRQVISFVFRSLWTSKVEGTDNYKLFIGAAYRVYTSAADDDPTSGVKVVGAEEIATDADAERTRIDSLIMYKSTGAFA